MRITAWTSAVVAMVLLAVTLLTYALMLRQVGEQANWTIEQQLRELEIFARDGVDPSTGQRFSSMPALIQGFVTSQTPYPGQAIIGIAGPDQTPVVADATPQDLGRRLAADSARLARLRDMPEASGIIDSDQGELRWGRQQVQIQAADGKQTGLVLVVCFTQPERRLARQRALVVGLVSMLGLAAVTAATWVVSGSRPTWFARIGVRERFTRLRDRVLAWWPRAGGSTWSSRIGWRREHARLAQLQDQVNEAYASQRRFLAEVQAWFAAPRRRIGRELVTLEADDLGPEQRTQAARRARGELDLMGTTLRHLELLVRLGQPGSVNRRPVQVGDLIRDLFAEISADDPARWRLLQVAEVEAWIDPVWIADAVRQLAIGADTETAPRRVIGLGLARCSDREGWFELWVVSPGHPVATQQVQAALEDPDTDAVGATQNGMGLGVAVVRAVADAHGGQAWLRTTKTATRVGLRLPVTVDSPTVPVAGTGQNQRLDPTPAAVAPDPSPAGPDSPSGFVPGFASADGATQPAMTILTGFERPTGPEPGIAGSPATPVRVGSPWGRTVRPEAGPPEAPSYWSPLPDDLPPGPVSPQLPITRVEPANVRSDPGAAQRSRGRAEAPAPQRQSLAALANRAAPPRFAITPVRGEIEPEPTARPRRAAVTVPDRE